MKKPAKKKPVPPVANQFKPGNKLGGRPKLTAEQRTAKALIIKHYPKFIIDMMTLPASELRERAKDEKTTLAERMFLGVAFKTAARGDVEGFMKIINRMVGTAAFAPHDNGESAPTTFGFTIPGQNGDDTIVSPRIIVNIPSNGREVRSYLEDQE